MTRDELLQAYAQGRKNFQWADLRGADFGGAYLVGADLRGVNLRGAYLVGANLGGADLERADLGGVVFGVANLRGADLGEAYLGGGDLRRAVIVGANLRGADLGGADLREADLGRADLGRANLGGANIGGAYLGGAYLGGAYLVGADLGDGVRLHESGTWTQPPPRCEVGNWWAVCLAPGVIRIGCTTLPMEEWLGDKGEQLAEEHKVSLMDQHVLRCWAKMLADLGDDLPGWKPDSVGEGT